VKALASALGLLLAATTITLAQQGVPTVNGYTPAQRAAAEAAVKAAGYVPGDVAYAQGGAVFLYGVKGPDKFLITVTADGKVHAGTIPFDKAKPAALGNERGR
jgi:hypothetical protein